MLLALDVNLNNCLLNYNVIGMVKLSQKTLEALKKLFLYSPTKTDNDIAKITGISQPTVSKYRKIYDEHIDQEFISITAGRFINEFGKAIDYWKLQIDRCEELYKKCKTPMEKLAVIRHQTKLRENIIFLGSQGEVREVIKIMRSGKLPALEAQ